MKAFEYIMLTQPYEWKHLGVSEHIAADNHGAQEQSTIAALCQVLVQVLRVVDIKADLDDRAPRKLSQPMLSIVLKLLTRTVNAAGAALPSREDILAMRHGFKGHAEEIAQQLAQERARREEEERKNRELHPHNFLDKYGATAAVHKMSHGEVHAQTVHGETTFERRNRLRKCIPTLHCFTRCQQALLLTLYEFSTMKVFRPIMSRLQVPRVCLSVLVSGKGLDNDAMVACAGTCYNIMLNSKARALCQFYEPGTVLWDMCAMTHSEFADSIHMRAILLATVRSIVDSSRADAIKAARKMRCQMMPSLLALQADRYTQIPEKANAGRGGPISQSQKMIIVAACEARELMRIITHVKPRELQTARHSVTTGRGNYPAGTMANATLKTLHERKLRALRAKGLAESKVTLLGPDGQPLPQGFGGGAYDEEELSEEELMSQEALEALLGKNKNKKTGDDDDSDGGYEGETAAERARRKQKEADDAKYGDIATSQEELDLRAAKKLQENRKLRKMRRLAREEALAKRGPTDWRVGGLAEKKVAAGRRLVLGRVVKDDDDISSDEDDSDVEAGELSGAQLERRVKHSYDAYGNVVREGRTLRMLATPVGSAGLGAATNMVSWADVEYETLKLARSDRTGHVAMIRDIRGEEARIHAEEMAGKASKHDEFVNTFGKHSTYTENITTEAKKAESIYGRWQGGSETGVWTGGFDTPNAHALVKKTLEYNRAEDVRRELRVYSVDLTGAGGGIGGAGGAGETSRKARRRRKRRQQEAAWRELPDPTVGIRSTFQLRTHHVRASVLDVDDGDVTFLPQVDAGSSAIFAQKVADMEKRALDERVHIREELGRVRATAEARDQAEAATGAAGITLQGRNLADGDALRLDKGALENIAEKMVWGAEGRPQKNDDEDPWEHLTDGRGGVRRTSSMGKEGLEEFGQDFRNGSSGRGRGFGTGSGGLPSLSRSAGAPAPSPASRPIVNTKYGVTYNTSAALGAPIDTTRGKKGGGGGGGTWAGPTQPGAPSATAPLGMSRTTPMHRRASFGAIPAGVWQEIEDAKSPSARAFGGATSRGKANTVHLPMGQETRRRGGPKQRFVKRRGKSAAV